ncbi:hypothetical protein K7432_003151 [Basidiobolus ranarum]|uniref:Pre-mRNA-processing factor 39 n=1 Tax=Basidiobolus ranarum TaxID=34480 RepID=A0ABR2W6L7_9FUNG
MNSESESIINMLTLLNLIHSVFGEGADAVGLDFLSHVFWDKYLEFEESREAYDKVMNILERVIRIPMHQYARYFERYTQLSATRSTSELVPLEQYKQFVEESTHEGQETTLPAKSDEEIEVEVRGRIHQLSLEIYTKTQTETNNRWIYEAEIKRPYFHVKPLDEHQLDNWRKYLDFEQIENDPTRIQFLFERCLVACALYEEFWERYTTWLISKTLYDDAKIAFLRATTRFLPQDQPLVRLSLAIFEEQFGDIDSARKRYKDILQYVPNHLETIWRFAQFERRQNPSDPSVAENILLSQLNADNLDKPTKAFLTVQRANLVCYTQKNISKAREIYIENSKEFSNVKYFWLNYFNFEYIHYDSCIESLNIALDLLHNTADLPSETFQGIHTRHLDFILERGVDVSSYFQSKSFMRQPTKSMDANKKRVSLEENPQPSKQTRINASTIPNSQINPNPHNPIYPSSSFTHYSSTTNPWPTQPGYSQNMMMVQPPYPYQYQYQYQYSTSGYPNP